MILTIRKHVSIEVSSFEGASRVYARYRDASFEGASTFPDGAILNGGRTIAHVSYNGKVWPPGKWREGQVPLFDPYAK